MSLPKKNTIQLITYPDSLGHDLGDLHTVLTEKIKTAVGGVHILPFYPSSADRGFAPLTHEEVDPRFGSWEDIERIAQKYHVMTDLIVNHISVKSDMFQDYQKNGAQSPYRDYFISANKFSKHISWRYQGDDTKAHLVIKWGSARIQQFFERYPIHWLESIVKRARRLDIFFHDHGVSRNLLKKIYRPRPGSPFFPFVFADGSKHYMWCTFSDNQIDLDVQNPGVRKMFKDAITIAAHHGVSTVRLDAVGYACKRRGTNNFLLPETFDFITWLADIAHEYKISVLPEVHNAYGVQLQIAKTKGVDYVYDFQLPLLVLHALFSGHHCHLVRWLHLRPENVITTLDTHDGLPVPDVAGLLTQEEIDAVIARVNDSGGNAAMRASGNNAENIDTYQLNVTYFSALGENEDAYIAARVIQFFVPGIPQVYYVGLLAGKNDIERLEKTGIGRDINRHGYTLTEIDDVLEQDVVRRLLRLMRLRNTHEAFSGRFTQKNSLKYLLILHWKIEDSFCEATINLKEFTARIRFFDQESGTVKEFTA